MSLRRAAPILVPLVLGLACRSAPKPAPKPKAEPKVAAAEKPAPPLPALPIAAVQGGRISADDPAWAAADGYRHTAAEYREPDWDHVRLHAVEHLAITGRDLARMHASRREWADCAREYAAAAAAVTAVPLADPAVTPVRDVLAAGLTRDAALCDALAKGTPPAAPTDGLAGFRSRYFALAQRAAKGEDVRGAARDLGVELHNSATTTLVSPPPAASDAPAAQALWLARAWDDTVDPVAVTEPWGAWTVEERPRQIAGLQQAIEAMVGGETRGLELRPAAAVAPQPVRWDAASFAPIPLFDAWVDLGGFAAPHVVPQVDLPADHEAQLDALVPRWGSMREGEVVRALRLSLADLKGRSESERYFGTLQLQNGVVRNLARGGHYHEVLEVLADESPPRGMDWFAPDRSAVLLGLEGRLRLLSGDAAAEEKLRAAMAESQSFLTFIAMCESLDAKAAHDRR